MKYDVVAKYDVVIIGSGISGLLCAIELAKKGKSVFITTKDAVTESSSLYAQGGMAVPLSNLDSFDKHLEDTLKTGCNLCETGVAKRIIEYSKTAFERLVDFGVKFDLNQDNTFHQTREAAHSYPRVVHVGGDASGRFITKALIDNACREPNISISQGTVALSLILNEDGEASGVLLEDINRSRYIISANDIILATGGIGQLYKNTTNPMVSTGDGLIMAYSIGAILQDLEMIQFHPTVCLQYKEPFLITEAIRGEGAKLKNINGEYFAGKYHAEADLAPRDILARAIYSEMFKTNSEYVYLDLSNFDKKYFEERFPTINQYCLKNKTDLFNKGIPVSPAVHYFIGGIKTDVNGLTNIPSLWAVGECSSNGLHGANRLASNSLLECIAVPQFLVEKLISSRKKSNLKLQYPEISTNSHEYNEKEIASNLLELKVKNNTNIGLIREEKNLTNHINWLSELTQKYNSNALNSNFKVVELNNMILLSKLISEAALFRKNSLGVHFRTDYPDLPNSYEHNIKVKDKELIKA